MPVLQQTIELYPFRDQKDESIEGSECRPGSNFYELAEFVDFLGELTRTR